MDLLIYQLLTDVSAAKAIYTAQAYVAAVQRWHPQTTYWINLPLPRMYIYIDATL